MIEIKINDELYPENLKKIKNPPEIIYVKGNIENLKKVGIAVVGSRSCSCYGKRMCELFTKELADYDIKIISGLALGIDTYAHKTCIENDGGTIAVLPCGLNKIYPKENEKLIQEILKNNGTLVTEYEPNEKADSKKFLERNRIVSGLAIGTLIIEAGYRSGTSVTARLTKEQGKNVFCIPSSLENRKGIVTNQLIQRGGYLVTKVEDILEKYENISFVKKLASKEENTNIDEEFRVMYEVLSDEPIDINKICRITRLDIGEVNYKLMLMELAGIITQLAGKRFIRN